MKINNVVKLSQFFQLGLILLETILTLNMEQQIGHADPCEGACEGEPAIRCQDLCAIDGSGTYATIVGRKYFRFDDWKLSVAGQWFQKFTESADEMRAKNTLFFDIEFIKIGGDLLPRLACWFESKPPENIGHYGTTKMNSDVNRKAFLRALYRADIIVGYNLFTLDIRALEYWGFDVEANLLKFIDPYQFFFKYVSDYHKGSLGEVSVLNGGSAKYIRNGTSGIQFYKQCQRDLEMLKYIFDRMLGGKVETSLLGTLDSREIWKNNVDPIMRRPRGPAPSFEDWSSVHIEYCMSVGCEGRCAI